MMRTSRILLLLTSSTCLAGSALAQPLSGLLAAPSPPVQMTKAPVDFTADTLSYNKNTNVITASGHVTAIQNHYTLRADKITINRTTNVVVASGRVSLVQPSGEVIYSDHIVLSDNMKNAVMTMVAARLADNARIIANGGRRYNGEIEELSKPVYSACSLCKDDPRAPPIWAIRATSATRDLQHKIIEFRDATLLFKGIPIFWLPYLSAPDPSLKRKTGLLIPSVGSTSELGPFIVIPYYITLGKSADITLAPVLAIKQGPGLKADYRKAFNRGILDIKLSGGQDRGHFGSSIFSDGTFDLNQYWRGGFAYSHASNPKYLNDFNILPNTSYLESNIYLEGFSAGSYARIDAQTYQGLVASVDQDKLPVVAPYAQYSYSSEPDGVLGGVWKINTSFFNILRNIGTDTRRLAIIPSYSVPFMLPAGVVGAAKLQLDTAYYDASKLDQQPNYSLLQRAETMRAQPYGAVMLRWPLVRTTVNGGSQLIEPIVQLVTSPNTGISQDDKIPNEDSLDLEFSDANLFSLNRYPGIDRLEGGSRVDYALHAAWYLPGGMTLDGMVGQSYRFHKDDVYLPASGLNENISDIVDRFTITPTPWFNISYRGRLSHRSLGNRMADVSTYFGTPLLNVSTGYLYTNTNPYALYDNAYQGEIINLTPPASYFQSRREATANISTSYNDWSASLGGRRNLETGRFDTINASLGWQNDCFGVNLIYYRRFTSFDLDNGSTLLLVQFDFKTLGNVGFNTL